MFLQLFNHQLHWIPVFTTLIPSLINLSIFIYALSKFDRSRVNNFFELFVLCLSLWQFSEFGFRASVNPYIAEKWYHLSGIFVLFVIVFGNLFVFRYTGLYKAIPKWIISFLLLGPLIIFLILIQLDYDEVVIISSPLWNWIGNPIPNFANSIISIWIGIGALTMLLALWIYYFKSKKGSIKKKQLYIMALGFSLPISVGIVVELIFPMILEWDSIPLSSPFVTTFSIATLVSIRKYHLLDFSPKHHWNDIIETINEGVLIVNTNNTIMYTNKAFLNLSKYNKEELIGKNAKNLFVHQNTETTSEILLKIKTGESIWVLSNTTPYRDYKNNIIGTIRFYTNIHQIKETKKNLKLINNELELYVYKASHDLRGPLATMLGLINIWKTESNTPSDNKQYLSMMEQTVFKLDATLLTLEKAMQIKEVDKLEDKINFKQLIEDILNGFKNYPDFNNMKINTDISITGEIISNKFILQTILHNLIENSIIYQRKDSIVPILSIKIQKLNGTDLQIIINDNGIGIKPEIQPEIFDMYFKGNERSAGSGLGLYIVKKSIDKLNGKINLHSDSVSGTTFSIFLPLEAKSQHP